MANDDSTTVSFRRSSSMFQTVDLTPRNSLEGEQKSPNNSIKVQGIVGYLLGGLGLASVFGLILAGSLNVGPFKAIHIIDPIPALSGLIRIFSSLLCLAGLGSAIYGVNLLANKIQEREQVVSKS